MMHLEIASHEHEASIITIQGMVVMMNKKRRRRRVIVKVESLQAGVLDSEENYMIHSTWHGIFLQLQSCFAGCVGAMNESSSLAFDADYSQQVIYKDETEKISCKNSFNTLE